MPDSIFHALHPNLTFTVQYADEHIGNSCGTCIYHNGKLPVEIEP
jgi:hypothetical protein